MEASTPSAVDARLKRSASTRRRSQEERPRREITLPGVRRGRRGKDILIFTRQFATMIDAGLPLVQCLDILAQPDGQPAFQEGHLRDQGARSRRARRSPTRCKDHPKVFDELYVQLCAAGEVGGILDTILNRLARLQREGREAEAQGQGRDDLPGHRHHASPSASPRCCCSRSRRCSRRCSRTSARRCPARRRSSSTCPSGCRRTSSTWSAASSRSSSRSSSFYRNPKGRSIFDKVILKVPLIGDVMRKVAVARFTRTLGTMISSGVPILDALDVTAKTAGNRTVEAAHLLRPQQDLRRQEHRRPAAETKVFPLDGRADDRRR